MATTFRFVPYIETIPHNQQCVLVGDIGGTNANFGFCTITDTTTQLLFSLHCKSQEIVHFADVVAEVLAYAKEKYGITVARACFAAAGTVTEARDYCKPTNLKFALRSSEIAQKAALQCVYIVNDFEVIGYGLPIIDPKALIKVHHGAVREHSNKAILGAGTGLGKCIMTWNKILDRHIPVASEGGHADFAAQNETEYALVRFIKEREGRDCNVSWEDVLSGAGITRIYAFFRQKDKNVTADSHLAANGLHPDTIFKNRNRDQHAWNTYVLYTKLYARCAKNFALDALALGGVYIAGGIASHNLPLFEQPEFALEFVNCGKKQEELADIPVYVITDYNISLHGVARYMLVEGICGV